MDTERGELRARLQKLQWGSGLTVREMLAQSPDLPQSIMEHLPRDYRFRDPGEVMSYVHHLLARGLLPENIQVAPVTPPIGYGDSPIGRTFQTHSTEYGVGSGASSGYTGSDAQTGECRQGVPYGHNKQSQAPE